MNKKITNELSNILDLERIAYLTADFAKISKYSVQKERLLNAKRQDILNAPEILDIKNRIERNQNILKSVMQGLQGISLEASRSQESQIYSKSGIKLKV